MEIQECKKEISKINYELRLALDRLLISLNKKALPYMSEGSNDEGHMSVHGIPSRFHRNERHERHKRHIKEPSRREMDGLKCKAPPTDVLLEGAEVAEVTLFQLPEANSLWRATTINGEDFSKRSEKGKERNKSKGRKEASHNDERPPDWSAKQHQVEQSKALLVPQLRSVVWGVATAVFRHPSPSVATHRLLPPPTAAVCCRYLPLFAVVVLFVGLVPTIMKGDGIAVENSAMVASRRGRSGHGTRGMSQNGKGGRGKLICSHCGKEGHLQNRCYDLIGWLNKTANISSSDIPSNERTSFQLISDEEYQEFLRLKSNNHTQSSTSSSVSTTCISHSMGSQGPWIIDSGASYHISGNDSVFSSISSPKFPHFISLANGSKMDRNTGQLIGKGHESRGLYYLSNNPST
ncbi:hypothetical protein CR513_02388, partial [Mucuna pruriens]